MVQRQQVYPWQTFGMQEEAPGAIAASKPESKRSKPSAKKRQRESAIEHPSPAKRQQIFVDSSLHNEPTMYHTSPRRRPASNIQRSTEVIDLSDDTDIPRKPHSVTPSVNLPNLRNPGTQNNPVDITSTRHSGTAMVNYPHLPNPGTQNNPVDLESDPLPMPGQYPQTFLRETGQPLNFKEYVGAFANTAAPSGSPAADIVPIVEPVLCPEQADLVDLILSGRNVFYTGSAGCGKSTVLKAFVKKFAERGIKVNILAPTGRAALDINGSTTWTYAGWTPDAHKKPLKRLRADAHGKYIRQRLTDTDVLVIDEISMVENHHFERLNHLMKEARNNELKAFGGVQVVVTGDFCQLPPVKPFRHCIECGRETIMNKEGTEYRCRAHGTYKDADKWAFASSAWRESNFAHVNLTQIHRQSDMAFIKILNKLRLGVRLPHADVDLLLNHESETRNAIQLFATRAEVNRVNEERFRVLRSTERRYQCLDHFKWNDAHGNLKMKGELKALDGSLQALAEHRFESQIRLKKGMLVVLLHNLDLNAGLCNGSQGVIQGWEPLDLAKLPKVATSREQRDGFTTRDTTVLQGDHAAFREWQVHDYAQQMEYKAWPIVR